MNCIASLVEDARAVRGLGGWRASVGAAGEPPHALPGPDGGLPSPDGSASEITLNEVRSLARTGALELCLPGQGRTRERFWALTAWARRDLVAARVVEGHADATAILVELGHRGVSGLLAVWAAEDRSERLVARRDGAGWILSGLKRWCSGARIVDAALVTAWADDGQRLFVVPSSAGMSSIPGSWSAVGMSGSDSRDVRFVDVTLPKSAAVGEPGAYLARPGFWHGATGVAACWYGGALGVADVLTSRLAARPDPHGLAHLGAVEAQLNAALAVLDSVADEIDADPLDRSGLAERHARVARSVVESAATEVLARVGRATGAGPLAHDGDHARRVADLTVYLRQSHGEADLEALGRCVVEALS